ncbi:hypothetical protein EC991_011236 [Linnemannia zychae]|nr:hypothetical protein EC991_011236 [Linnemannia zychae]
MKFITTLAALATATICSVSAQYTDFANGATGPVQFTATNYAINPYPLCINKPFCLTATGTVSNDIVEGATYTVTGRYIGRLVYSDSHDLCPLLAASGTPCPIPAGAFNLNICVPVKPNLPPNISFHFQFAAVNGDGGSLFVQKTPGWPGLPGTIPSTLYGVNCP